MPSLLILTILQARAKQSQQVADLEAGAEGINGLSDSDNEVYEAAREKKKRKKDAKTAKYAATPTAPPLEEELVAGPRKVTREVDQNRGLTPHRRKDMKNPRVKVSAICQLLHINLIIAVESTSVLYSLSNGSGVFFFMSYTSTTANKEYSIPSKQAFCNIVDAHCFK